MALFFDNKYEVPRWLGSDVGKVLKTIEIPADFATTEEVVDINGSTRKIVRAGTYVATPYKGLLYNDTDITDGARIASVMIRGSYVDALLPASVASVATDLAAQGLYSIVEGAFTRPEFAWVEPNAVNFGGSTYLYPLGENEYPITADGYSFNLSKSALSGVDYEIAVSGEISLIDSTTKTGLGYDNDVTNIFVALIEIQTNNFDITKLKYCRHGGTLASVTADDIYTMNGKTYLINAFGVYDTDSSGTIGNKVVSPANMNLIDIQYNGVTKVYKYTYTQARLAE